MEAPILTQSESGKEYVVYSDASLNGLGCVLITIENIIAYRSSDCTECHCLLFFIKNQDIPLDFGVNFTKLWVRNSILAQHFIHRRTDSQDE
ncbi:CCHC-type integrase [Gossypium australe]|uniref:CCHC-type integrase n=1 Tax=Gossypium australe TaxID=47621 RepID=A0A5B6WFD2_9ROSI|nr:CCHC-type integrase [Gossypium australe]